MPAKKIIKRAVVGILLTLVALVVAGGMMGFAKTPAKLDFEEAQIWAHRGLSVEFEENSLNAIREAFDAGAAGVEIDVHYIAKFDRFTVMHDAWENSNLDELLTLETVFRSMAGRGRFWLDFKNLSTKNDVAASRRLRELFDKYGLYQDVYVESRRARALRVLASDGIQTIYWISNRPETTGMFSPRHLRFLFNIYSSEFSALSIPANDLSDSFLWVYGDFPIFTFTVNDRDEIDFLLNDPHIRVILTDLQYYPN